MTRISRVEALARSIDGERAEDYRARFAGPLGEGTEAHAIATLLATAYPAVASALVADPEIARYVAAEGYRLPRDRASLTARLAKRGLSKEGLLREDGADPSERFRAELRRAARDERARIALRELLPASLGGADVDVTASELSVLADVTVDLALTEARFSVFSRFGEPRVAGGGPAQFVVLGMGKLGGGELNAGSDVDLIYFYDTDDGSAKGPDGDEHALFDVWSRVARRMTTTLHEPTAEGFVWRVDLRLRPEGQSGPVVGSFASAERYYEAFGRLWERAALLRARPIAGDIALGDAIVQALVPFVWKRVVDPSIAVEMTHLVRRARSELSRSSARDLKHGKGGIREAEFFVQSLQLIWGGREARVRARGTLSALRKLRATGYVTDREARDLTEAYLALRRAEHAVQVASGVQTHELPAEGPELTRIARALGFATQEDVVRDIDAHRARVAERFASLLPDGPPPVSRWTEVLAALDGGDRDNFAEAIQRTGVFPTAPDHAARADQMARDLFDLSRHPDGSFGVCSRERYPALAETLLDAIADAADPEQAARYIKVFFSRLGQPGVYVRLVGDRPQAVRRLVEALGASAFIGDAVAGHPELGDLVLFDRALPSAALARSEIDEAAREPVSDDDPDESFVASLRRAKARVTVRVGLGHLASEIPTRAATATLTALADASLEAATRHVLGVPLGEAVHGLAVLAMGKLGGRDVGYGSDLDVIFLYDPAALGAHADVAAEASRAARHIIRLISTSHAAGPGYELDTRLRPSGSQGLLVTSIEAFARYHGQGQNADAKRVGAATWERLALLRARCCAGDLALGERAMRIAHRTAYEGAVSLTELAREIHRVRVRMEVELGSERRGRYDLKFGRGGLADVEFCVQLLQMVHGADPAVRTTDTRLAIDALAERGYLATAHADVLRDGYAFLRELEERIRIVHADSAHLLEERAPGLAPLARRMGLRDRPGTAAVAELLARYRDVTERVRAVYEALVLTPGSSP